MRMRTTRYLYSTGSVTLVACLAALASGCSGNSDGDPAADGPTSAGPVTGTTGDTSAGPVTGGGGSTGSTAASTNGATTTGASTGTTGGDPPDPSVCIPGVPETSQVARIKNTHYDNIVRDLLGVTTLANGEPPSSLLNTDSIGAMNTYMWEAYQNAATNIAAEVMAGDLRGNFISCDPAMDGCLEQTIVNFGRKAFRRPLTDDEVQRFVTLGTNLSGATPPASAEEIAETTLMAFLKSAEEGKQTEER